MINRSFLILYMILSGSFLFLTFNSQAMLLVKFMVLAMVVFYGLALMDHFKEISNSSKEEGFKKVVDGEGMKILLGSSLAAAVTWYINHKLGYGAVVANGVVGVAAGFLFSPKLAGAYYLASFIGMSSQEVVPSLLVAGITGLVSGTVFILSQQVYAGIGGKGGTIAALSTQMVRNILSLFI